MCTEIKGQLSMEVQKQGMVTVNEVKQKFVHSNKHCTYHKRTTAPLYSLACPMSMLRTYLELIQTFRLCHYNVASPDLSAGLISNVQVL